MFEILDNLKKTFDFDMKNAETLSRFPDLNESEKAAIREALGACKLIATVLKMEAGNSSIKAEYKRRRAGILAAAGMEG